MKIVLSTEPAEPNTYTGDPKNWPDGLYLGSDSTTFILVYQKQDLMFGNSTKPSGACWFSRSHPAGAYTRIPGYTGGIASITPDREAKATE